MGDHSSSLSCEGVGAKSCIELCSSFISPSMSLNPLLFVLLALEGVLLSRSYLGPLDFKAKFTSGVGGLDVAEADERSERWEKIEDALLDIEGLVACIGSTGVSTSYGFPIEKSEYSFGFGGESFRTGGRVSTGGDFGRGGEIPLPGRGAPFSISSPNLFAPKDGCLRWFGLRLSVIGISGMLGNGGVGRTFNKFVEDLFFL